MNEFNMIQFQYRNSNHFNYNMFNATGDDLERFMTYLVERGTWEKGSNYFFHNYNPRLLRPHYSCTFKIKPNPTIRQPGNGHVTFYGHKAFWSTFENEMKNFNFPTLRNEFLSEKLGIRNILEWNGTTRAIVLMCFEVARRVRVIKTLYPITREETKKAINEVMRTAEEEDYELKVDLLIKMFRSGGSRNNYAGRKKAYNEIMRYSIY